MPKEEVLGKDGKVVEKPSPAPPSKKHMVTIWVAIATALGSTGIPKIVNLLDTKPSVEQVQIIVAEQLMALSKEQPVTVEAILELDKRMLAIEKSVAETCGRVDVLKELLLKKRNGNHKRAIKTSPASIVELAPPSTLFEKSSIEKLKKVPKFDIQQQLQLPLQEEPKR